MNGVKALKLSNRALKTLTVDSFRVLKLSEFESFRALKLSKLIMEFASILVGLANGGSFIFIGRFWFLVRDWKR